jgi:putative ABC transport system permease protein
VLFLISLVGSIAIIVLLKPLAEAQIGHKLTSSLNFTVIMPLFILLVLVVLLVSYLPGRFFVKIPVAYAFRNYRQKSTKWKLGLLSLQFIGASFIFTMLIIVTLQYQKLQNANHGYQSENVYYCSSAGITGSKLSLVLNELRAIPEIESVGLGFGIPFEGASGNNLSLPNSEKELFNVADFYWIDDNYLSILNIPVTQGSGFARNSTIQNEILISQKGSQMLTMNTGWKDGVVGKEVKVSAHGINTISGVFPDFIIRSITNPDSRPAVFSYLPEERFQSMIEEYPSFSFNILIKTQQGVHIGITKKITEIINLALPQKDAIVKSFQTEQLARYSSEKGFRNTMIASNFIILIITIMGLLGYTIAEALRRRKELAIRKISGARITDILRLFVMELEYIALPAVLVGLIGAWYIAGKWMENFATKLPLHWGIFAICSLSILVMVALVATINYISFANRNPIEALKHE